MQKFPVKFFVPRVSLYEFRECLHHTTIKEVRLKSLTANELDQSSPFSFG